MTAASRTLYTGDGVIKQFNISFPFISSAHLMIFVNETLQLTPMNYTLSGSTVTFNDAPEQDAAIEFRRNTSPTAILVDFVNGSVLNENDLDTAYLHNFYLYQEATDSYTALIEAAMLDVATGVGIVETDPDLVIAALVAEMLNQTAAASLQQRVNDIDTNAEAIIQLGTDIQVQVNTIAQGTAAIVYVQATEPVPGVGGIPDPIADGARWYDSDDNNKPYIYDQGATAWVSLEDPRIGVAVADITVLQASTATNNALILSESIVHVNAYGAIASDLALLGVSNGGGTAFILDLDTVEVVDGVETLANRFSTLSAADSTNATDITTEESARISADSAEAALRVILAARVTVNEGDVSANAAQIITEASVAASASGANASDITALEATVDLRNRVFSQAAPPTADNIGDLWIETDNGNLLHRWNGTGWTAVQDAAIAGNASAISSTDAQVSTNEGNISSQAGSISVLQADVVTVDGRVDSSNISIAANVTAISNNDTDITDLYAHYGVTLDVNGYITGFAQNNDGVTGSFAVLADKFGIVTPSTVWQATTAYSVGQNIRPTSPTSPARVFECTTAGTSGGTEPTWDTVIDNTNADGSAVWTTKDDAALNPFTVSGDKITMNGTVEINGSLLLNGSIVGAAMVAGTIGSTQIGANAITTTQLNANAVTANEINANAITADKILANAVTAAKISVTNLAAVSADLGAITAGSIVLDTSGFIRGGQTAYMAGTGFFLGYEGGQYKFSIGDGTDFIKWDGTSLVVRGNVSIGSYEDHASTVLLAATTQRITSGAWASTQQLKAFSLNRTGTVRCKFDKRLQTIGTGLITAGEWRIKVDGVSKANGTITTASNSGVNQVITLGSGSSLTIEITNGWYDNSGEPTTTQAYILNAYLYATKNDGEEVTQD